MFFSNRKLEDLGQEQHTFKYFTLMYAVALTIIAFITIMSQVLIQKYLSNQIDDSHVINFAAKLRTYSQTLSKTALLLESGRDIETNRKDFINSLRQWQKSHIGLTTGSDFLNLPANDREEMEQMFNIIKAPYQEISEASNDMVKELYSSKPLDSLNIQPFVRKILANEKAYMLGMELIVFDYDRFSRGRVSTLKEIEYILLGFVIFTLGLEAMFIFYPLSVKIKHVIKGLIDSEVTSKTLADQIKEANSTLEKSHIELRDLTFALEKANYLVKTDKECKIIYANEKYCHVTRYTMSELRDKPLFYNNMGGKESIIYEHVHDPTRKREFWQGEIFDHASDGTGFWLDVTLMPLIDYKGELYQYLVICTDITKRKNTERELRLLTEEKLRRQDSERKIKSYSMINGQEKERKRVAAEIHDGIGQMLTSMRMKVEIIESKNPHLNGEISHVHDMLKTIINETKRICSDLLPSVLEDFGLSAAIKELIKICKEINPSISFDLEESITGNLPREIEIGVFRILQEAMNNITKHSQASRVFIQIDHDEQYFNLIVEDNGKGFFYDENSVYSKEFIIKSNGLRNMKERAELLGGVLNITSEIGKGTILQLELPILI
ncbi:MAG: PAS domain S-box protein [Opitutaceae bacterium]|nr:PAS domain S-box protein [Cytophagales bacterium]